MKVGRPKEHAIEIIRSADIPLRQISIKLEAMDKHVAKRLDVGNIPLSEGLVKVLGHGKGAFHGNHIGGLPLVNVLVEGWALEKET